MTSPTKGFDDEAARSPRDVLEDTARALRSAMLTAVWRQWHQLGAAASAPLMSSNADNVQTVSHDVVRLVDPEALLHASLAMMHHERRLQDVIADWVATNADLLSVQRFRNLRPRDPRPGHDETDIAWLAAVACDLAKDVRWKPLMSPSIRATPPRTMRNVRAHVRAPASLMLRLRLAFGVGVKADVLAVLLAHPDAALSVRALADETGYTVASVRRAAADLALARFVGLDRGSPARYRAHREAWSPLLGWAAGLSVSWSQWSSLFRATAAIMFWEESSRDHPLTPYPYAVRARALLREHPVLTTLADVVLPSEDNDLRAWSNAFERSAVALAAIFRGDVEPSRGGAPVHEGLGR